MGRYFIADMHRIFRRIPRYIIVVLLFGLLGYIMYSATKDEVTIYQLVEVLVKAVPYISIGFGLIEYIYVFTEDFKAKTMQVAIGTGISRRKVILTKWLESGFLCAFDYIVLIAVIFIAGGINGISFAGDSAKDVYILFLFGWIKAFICTGMTMIVVFLSQATTGGMLLYLALSTGIIKLLLETLLDIDAIKFLGLSSILLSNLIDTARSRAILGTFSTSHIIGIIIYAAACYIASWMLFKNRELEF